MSGKKFVYDKGRKENFLDGDNLVFSVFFDGTQNNKTNTESEKGKDRRKKIEEHGIKSYNARLEDNFSVEEEPVKLKDNSPIYGEFKIEEVKLTPVKEKADSYENDYTNIARLFYSYDLKNGDFNGFQHRKNT